MNKTVTLKWILKNIEEIIATTAIALMLIICTCNVFSRYILRSAISWSDEVCVCMLAWTTFVGGAAAYKKNLHYGMDFIMDRLPEAGKRWMRFVITAVIGATCAFLTYQSFMFTLNAVKVMPFSRLSYKWLDASAVAGFGSMTVYSVIYMVQALCNPMRFNMRYHSDQDVYVVGEEGKA